MSPRRALSHGESQDRWSPADLKTALLLPSVFYTFISRHETGVSRTTELLRPDGMDPSDQLFGDSERGSRKTGLPEAASAAAQKRGGLSLSCRLLTAGKHLLGGGAGKVHFQGFHSYGCSSSPPKAAAES